MRILVLIALCLLAVPAFCSHIVGGEFEFLFKKYDAGKMHYSLRLLLYFDLKNGDPGAEDQFVDVRIYSKNGNTIMRDLRLYLSTKTNVEYFQPECSSGSAIETSKLVYEFRTPGSNVESDVIFDPNLFDDPAGYYIVWERCCRNYNLVNIYSENPNAGQNRNAGQTYYLEIPPMMTNGGIFINSSPRLFPPLADYACPKIPYYVDFSGSDDDGDSLVYSMVTPLNTHQFEPLPATGYPGTAPFPNVTYRPGFSSGNIMKGKPDLQISWDGVLTVTPTVSGLFAFAVKVEEYRNKVKIGEVRRDFQMLVLTSCAISEKPVVEAKSDEAPDSDYGPAITVDDNNLCIDVRISDPDAAVRAETLTVTAFLVKDRRRNINSELITQSTYVLQNGQSALVTVCFPECPFENEQHQVGLIVSDKSCPLPRRDTVMVTVNRVRPANAPPLFNKETITDIVTEGTEIPAWNETFTGTDADGEPLTLTLDPATPFDPADFGFELVVTENSPGKISAKMNWDTRCDVFDFSMQTQFVFSYLLDDTDKCDDTPSDILTFDLTRDFDDFHYPEIKDPTQPNKDHIEFEQKIYAPLSFVAHASDVDNDILDVSGQGVGFTMTSVGASFPNKTFVGSGQQTFSWTPNCDVIDLAVKDTYDFELMVVDNDNNCHYLLTDTLFVTVKVLPPDNIPPVLAIDGSTERSQKTTTVGEPFILPLQGTDGDDNPADRLTLELVGVTGPITAEGYTFESTPAIKEVDGTLTWTPECNVFANGLENADFVFAFRVMDDRCYTGAEDLLEVDVHVKDRVPSDVNFNPRPNVVTSNGDGINDFFGMYRLDEDGTTLINILPIDNCEGRFVDIDIYNRWGRRVFTSSDREFKWYPDESQGVYYYRVNYSNREYTGVVHVIGEGSK